MENFDVENGLKIYEVYENICKEKSEAEGLMALLSCSAALMISLKERDHESFQRLVKAYNLILELGHMGMILVESV